MAMPHETEKLALPAALPAAEMAAAYPADCRPSPIEHLSAAGGFSSAPVLAIDDAARIALCAAHGR